MPSTVWILAAVALTALVGLTAVMLWWGNHRRSPNRLPQDWPLMQRPVFSWEERALYRQLRVAMPNHTVLAKLPLVRFCQPIERQDLRYWFELLGPIHVSFVVCAPNGRALAAIDIDKPERKVSERTLAIKQAVLEACHIRYVKCRADQLPSIAELQLLVPAQGEQARPQVPNPFAETDQRSSLAHSVRAPRRGNVGDWKESGFAADSFFAAEGIDDLADERPSDFPPSRYPPSAFDPSAAASRAEAIAAEPPTLRTVHPPREAVRPTAAAGRDARTASVPIPTPRRASSAAPPIQGNSYPRRANPPAAAEPISFPGSARNAREAAEHEALREELRQGLRQDLRLEPRRPAESHPAAAPAALDLRLDPLLKPPILRPVAPTRQRSEANAPMSGGFAPNIMPLHRTGPGPANVAGTLAEDFIGRDFGDTLPQPLKPRSTTRLGGLGSPGSTGNDGDHIIGRS